VGPDPLASDPTTEEDWRSRGALAASTLLQANYPHIVKKKCDDFTHLSMSFGGAINTGQELGH
jgi:hypothetical protein